MRISAWSSDVCSSDLVADHFHEVSARCINLATLAKELAEIVLDGRIGRIQRKRAAILDLCLFRFVPRLIDHRQRRMCRGVVALRLDGRLQLLDRQTILTLARIVDAQLRVDLRLVPSRCPLPTRHTRRARAVGSAYCRGSVGRYSYIQRIA